MTVDRTYICQLTGKKPQWAGHRIFLLYVMTFLSFATSTYHSYNLAFVAVGYMRRHQQRCAKTIYSSLSYRRREGHQGV